MCRPPMMAMMLIRAIVVPLRAPHVHYPHRLIHWCLYHRKFLHTRQSLPVLNLTDRQCRIPLHAHLLGTVYFGVQVCTASLSASVLIIPCIGAFPAHVGSPLFTSLSILTHCSKNLSVSRSSASSAAFLTDKQYRINLECQR